MVDEIDLLEAGVPEDPIPLAAQQIREARERGILSADDCARAAETVRNMNVIVGKRAKAFILRALAA